MTSIAFDRPRMRHLLLKYLAVCVGGTVFLSISVGLLGSQVASVGWQKFFVIVAIAIAVGPIIDYSQYLSILIRGLRRKESAIVINQDGIVDNASYLAIGQLSWNEITRMYPGECNSRLFTNWWAKMPVITEQRGVVVVLKDDADLQHLLKNRSWLFQAISKNWYCPSKSRWLFIPEMVLPVTSEELIEQINKFYVTQVRGY